ncbi:heat shock 70 kDa protein 12A-like [Saccostrea cucullata]|uniref:heat shock 70 kDa protein 12A-like n=1 Tax=Saccostrea cuccullata TaxID=36930 RepID=UPI002ED61EE2
MASGLEEKVSVSGLEERVSRMAVHGGIEEVKKGSQRDSRVVIAAIDFGTTYSGYAYAFKSDLDKAKDTKEMCNILSKTWQSGSDAGLISHKTPTCLLLNSEGKFDSFGFQAEEKYNNLTNDNAHVGWRFFRRFKMILLNEKHLSKETVIPDDQNNNMEAVAVFAHSIKYIKNELWNQLQKTGCSIDAKEIHWVLTIPAIWNPRSKQFMRLAAEQAGIPGNQLEFALEPEAAAVYVKETKVAKESVSADEHQLVPFKPGTQFMVLDLGGGTIDISVKEVLKDRTLKELHRASGNGLGGESVNIRFLEFFESVFGKDSWSKFKNENEYKAAFYDLENEIEQKKRTLPFDNKGNLKINIPPDLVEIFDQNDNNFEEHVESLEGLRYKSGRLYIDKKIVMGVFQPSVTSIIKLVREILNDSNVGHVSDIMMVGGFSQSPFVSKAIKDAFADKNVIVPNVADMAVLQGAVIYRHWPEVVRTRRSPFTYGSRLMRLWLDGDDVSKKIKRGNEVLCGDHFEKFVTINDEFKVNERATISVFPVAADTTEMAVDIYTSTEKNPRYTTDQGCERLGRLVVQMADTTGGLNRQADVTMTMGSTEITVEGKMMPKGKPTKVTFDMLSSK